MERDGQKIWDIANRIFPICRSITGNGVRDTLQILKEYIPELQLFEVPSGTEAFDWTVPKEWNIRGGGIWYEDGTEVINFKNCNLHIMGYSAPVDRWMELEELLTFIYTQPDQPEAIPYVTSYYNERFGFCMSEHQKKALKRGNYHVVVDSELSDGSLTYGELLLPGDTKEELFFSTYICHPSMGNNECSGPALAAYLTNWIKNMKTRRYTYRFIFIPETIGSIVYLSRNIDYMKKHVAAGFNLSCVGDALDYSIVESRYGNTLADRVLKNVLRYHYPQYSTYSYLERGSDERQYNAPGVDLPVAAFCRSKYGVYKEYHTSTDNMEFISPEGFQGSFNVLCKCILALERNYNYKVTVLCEPQLSKMGLYPTISKKGTYDAVRAMTNFIAYADGTNDLLDISHKIGVPCDECIKIAEQLIACGLLCVNAL